MDWMVAIICVLVVFYGLISLYLLTQLGTTSKFQRQRIEELDKTINQFTLASLAYKASKEINPTTGPAVLQQLGKMDQVEELEKAPQPTRTGMTIRQGSGTPLQRTQ